MEIVDRRTLRACAFIGRRQPGSNAVARVYCPAETKPRRCRGSRRNGGETRELAVRPKPSDLVRRDRPTEPLQIELANESRLDLVLDSSEDPLTDQDLTSRGLGAKPGGEVRHWPERSVVIPTFEANPAERRVTRLDSDPEGELRTAFLPHPRQLR